MWWEWTHRFWRTAQIKFSKHSIVSYFVALRKNLIFRRVSAPRLFNRENLGGFSRCSLITQKGVEHSSPSNAQINECTKKVPYNFFYIVEGHLNSPLIIKKKKARVVMIVLATADTSMILCEMFTRFIYQIFIFFNISGNCYVLLWNNLVLLANHFLFHLKRTCHWIWFLLNAYCHREGQLLIGRWQIRKAPCAILNRSDTVRQWLEAGQGSSKTV